MNNELIKNRLYYVESNTDDTVLVAMELNINFRGKVISWFDSVKDRVMEFETILDENSGHFVFKRSGRGETYTFIPMTLEIYNSKVKNRILIPRNFETEENMVKAFKETKNNAW